MRVNRDGQRRARARGAGLRLAVLAAAYLMAGGCRSGSVVAARPAVVSAPTAVAAPESAPSLGTYGPSAVMSLGPTDFWIVSSRRCPQLHSAACSAAWLDYYRLLPDGRTQAGDLRQFVAATERGWPVCMVIHGSQVTLDAAVRHGRVALGWLRDAVGPDVPLTYVVYTWPSEDVVPLLVNFDVAIKGRMSDTNAMYVASLVEHIPRHVPVSLVGHSHGARIACGALELLAGGEVQGRRLRAGGIGPAPRPLRAVLLAAAIDHDWVAPGERYGSALAQVDAMLLVTNSRDLALAFYPLRKLPIPTRALGHEGLSAGDWEDLGPLAARVRQVDVAEVIGSGHHQLHYFRSSQIGRMVAPYAVFFVVPP